MSVYIKLLWLILLMLPNISILTNVKSNKDLKIHVHVLIYVYLVLIT
jgi:hypothetical protein